MKTRNRLALIVGATAFILVLYLLIMGTLKFEETKSALNIYTQNRIASIIAEANAAAYYWDSKGNNFIADEVSKIGELLNNVGDLYAINKSQEKNMNNFMSDYYYNLSTKFSYLQANNINKKMIEDLKLDLELIHDFNKRTIKVKGQRYKLKWDREILNRLKINEYYLTNVKINSNLPQILYDENAKFDNEEMNLITNYAWKCRNLKGKTLEISLEIFVDGKLIKNIKKTKMIKDGVISLSSKYPTIKDNAILVEFMLEVDKDKDSIYIKDDFFNKSNWGATYAINTILEKNRTYNMVTSSSTPNGYKIDSNLENED